MRVWARRCVFLGLALLAVYAVGRLGLDDPPASPPAPSRAQPSALRGVRVTDEDVDGTRWTVSAASGTGWESEGTGRLDDVTAVFERGGKKVFVRAASGEAAKGESVTLAGDVRVAWGEFEAATDRVTYLRGKGLVRSEGPVSLVGRRLKVQGTGLEVDVEGRTVRVLSKVRATVGGSKP